MSSVSGHGGRNMTSGFKPTQQDHALEHLLVAIEFDGPSVLFHHEHWQTLRWVKENYQLGYRKIIEALRTAGMERSDIVSAIQGEEHGLGCACWDCVLRLHGEVLRSQTERRIQHPSEMTGRKIPDGG
jgi:hypothetical protein